MLYGSPLEVISGQWRVTSKTQPAFATHGPLATDHPHYTFCLITVTLL